MRTLITGATGFIGRALTRRLLAVDHQVSAWVRDAGKARTLLGPDVTLAASGDPAALKSAIAQADAVINLAGEPVMGGRWTPRRKRAISASRVDLTRAITQAIAECAARPTVLISASAVGYYGDRGDEAVEDDAPPGTDFLARLCREWEAAALAAREASVRVFIPRIGIVLGREGGALAKIIGPFRLGLGGPIGSGRQYVPWIHLDDLIEMITIALVDQRFSEPMIAAAPNPVTNRDFVNALAQRLHRPCLVPAPAIALKLILGEAATPLLTGQRVRPQRLENAGFRWRYLTIDAALAAIISGSE
jgi:uncharacterized protein (TIGR01777 family)